MMENVFHLLKNVGNQVGFLGKLLKMYLEIKKLNLSPRRSSRTSHRRTLIKVDCRMLKATLMILLSLNLEEKMVLIQDQVRKIRTLYSMKMASENRAIQQN